jgi:hypothetical protein
MARVTRAGWVRVLLGGLLMRVLRSPLGLPLLWLGVPMGFCGSDCAGVARAFG